jgi:acyl dehydratase
MLTLNGIDELKSRVGDELGVSDWHEVTQDKIDAFAEVTGDDQWIHVDPERAKDTPFGGTIAHGYYTLSLAPRFQYDLFKLDGIAFGLNYGLGIPGGAQITMKLTFEREGGDKPVCVAEALSRVYTG